MISPVERVNFYCADITGRALRPPHAALIDRHSEQALACACDIRGLRQAAVGVVVVRQIVAKGRYCAAYPYSNRSSWLPILYSRVALIVN